MMKQKKKDPPKASGGSAAVGGGAAGGSALSRIQSKLQIKGVDIDTQKIKQKTQEHMKQKVMVVNDTDREVLKLVLNVPVLQVPVAIICAVLNLITPGFGTILAACSAEDTVSKTQLSIGILQFMTSVFLVGWILSIYWGYLLYITAKKATDSASAKTTNLKNIQPGLGQT